MPNYWNPNNLYPATYPQMGYSGMPMQQQSYAQQPIFQVTWVDGEIEARGRQIPQGVTQFYMFDTNKPVIYLKSVNQMGMPNPMQILDYTIRENNSQNLLSGQTMSGTNNNIDMSQYVTKQDLEVLRNEIRQMGQSGANSTGSNQSSANNNQNGNRGGNR